MCKLFYPLSMLSLLLLFSCNAHQNKSEAERPVFKKRSSHFGGSCSSC